MSNVRLLTVNRAIGATLKNGTGGAAPAKVETSPYLMTNALFDDRYTVWGATPATSFAFDIDLGADRLIDTIGLAGLRYSGATDIGSILCHYSTQAAGYAGGVLSATPPGWSTVSSSLLIPNPSLTRRDFALAITPATGRYWRFDFYFDVLGAFTLGKLLLGSVVDLGRNYSPGAQWSPSRVRLELPSPVGQDLIVDMGDKRWLLDAEFRNVSLAVKDQLAGLADLTGTFVLLDADDNAYEMKLRDGSIRWTDVFHPPYSVQLAVASLP